MMKIFTSYDFEIKNKNTIQTFWKIIIYFPWHVLITCLGHNHGNHSFLADTLWIYPSGYSTLYLTHTHTCVPTKNGERPLAYTILIVHLHTLNTANSLPPTPKSGDLKPISLPLTPKSGDLKPIYLNLHTQIIKSEEKIPNEFLKYHFLFFSCFARQ